MASKGVRKKQLLSASSEATLMARLASLGKSADSTVRFTLPEGSVSASETWSTV